MVSAGVVVVVVDNGTSYKLHLEQLWLLSKRRETLQTKKRSQKERSKKKGGKQSSQRWSQWACFSTRDVFAFVFIRICKGSTTIDTKLHAPRYDQYHQNSIVVVSRLPSVTHPTAEAHQYNQNSFGTPIPSPEHTCTATPRPLSPSIFRPKTPDASLVETTSARLQ